MITSISRFIALMAFSGSLFWIYKSPHEIEPYVTAIALFGGLIASFLDYKKKERPQLWMKALGLENLTSGKTPSIKFEFDNSGDADAHNLRIESGVYVSRTKLISEPPEIVFLTPPSPTLLPKGKTMTKTLPFARAITDEELHEIEHGHLFVYAYAVLRYEYKKSNFELKTCSIYNSGTTYFQHTPFFNSNT